MEIIFYLLQFFQILDIVYADSADSIDPNANDSDNHIIKSIITPKTKKVVITLVIVTVIIIMIFYKPQDPGPIIDINKLEEFNLYQGDLEIFENVEKYYEKQMLKKAIDKIIPQDKFSDSSSNYPPEARGPMTEL